MTMKTIENAKNHNIERIGDDDAHKLVQSGEWRYVPKSKWKYPSNLPAFKPVKVGG